MANKLSPATPAPEMDKYMVKDAMHKIMEVHEFKKDKDLMRQVKRMAGDLHKAIGIGNMKKKSGMAGEKPMNPSDNAKGKKALGGLKMAQREQGKKPSKVAKAKGR